MSPGPFPRGAPSASFFVARTPLLPFDDLLAAGEGLRAPSCLGAGSALEAALVDDWRDLRRWLADLLQRPVVKEALFLATPEFGSRVDGAGSMDGGGRVELAAARYVLRMCGRPTPFGLFAGCTLGGIGAETAIDLLSHADYRRHARLDNDYLYALVALLERAPELAATLRFRPNSGLYAIPGSLRYAETRLVGRARTNHLVALEATDYLSATLERAENGATLAELATSLVQSDPEVSPEEAGSFIEQLVSSQILVSDLAPAVTGEEPLDDLIRRIAGHPAATATRACLERTRVAINGIEQSPLGLDRESYVALARGLETLPADVDLSRLLQVDLVKPAASAVLGPEPLAEILRGAELLWRLTPMRPHPLLERFKNDFLERYEGREVPLVEALDEDLGLEFRLAGRMHGGTAPLLDRLHFPAMGATEPAFTAVHEFLQRKVAEVLAAKQDELVLETSDIPPLQRDVTYPLPPAFSAMATLGASSAAAAARGEFEVVLHCVGGPSGANLLGRFCHADDALRANVTEHLRAEELHDPHALFAEVVHLPDGRVGNIAARPVLRDYEIPYLGRSSAARERQIPVSDLLLAVEGNRLVLRSRRWGREVVPRLTSAHNFTTSSLPIYRFLGALQHQDLAPWLCWDWGPLASLPFLPRVRSGRLILSAARWQLSKDDSLRLRAASGATRYRLVQEWRANWHVPRYVHVAEGDQRLPLDLDSVLCVEVLVDLAGRGGGATLHEMIPRPEGLLARGPEGRFIHELIVPFVQPAPPAKRPAVTRPPTERTRSFPPGTEWFYAKLYTSESGADRVLREVVSPLRRHALDRGHANHWFFIRYVDPQGHVRIRFHGDPSIVATTLLPVLLDLARPLLQERTVWRMQLDTYEREVERYGGDEAVLLAERLFFADSEAVIELLGHLEGDQGARTRSRLALVGIDRMLDDFGFDLAQKRWIVSQLRDSLGHDVGLDKGLRVRLGTEFRSMRRELEQLLEPHDQQDEGLAVACEIFRRRSARLVPIANELTALQRSGRLTAELPTIVSSYVHMFVNRLLRSEHKRQEFVLYDYLNRLYESQTARRAG